MPRCRSSAKESCWGLPSSTLPIWSMTPASTRAKIPKFNIRIKLHILRIGGKCRLDGYDCSAHFRLLGRLAVDRSIAPATMDVNQFFWRLLMFYDSVTANCSVKMALHEGDS